MTGGELDATTDTVGLNVSVSGGERVNDNCPLAALTPYAVESPAESDMNCAGVEVLSKVNVPVPPEIRLCPSCLHIGWSCYPDYCSSQDCCPRWLGC